MEKFDVTECTYPPEIVKTFTDEKPHLKYEHMKFVTSTNLRKPVAKSGKCYTIEKDPYWVQFSKHIDTTFFEENATYYRVRPTEHSVEIATKKFDVPRSEPDNAIYKKAEKDAMSYLSYIESEPLQRFDVNLKASAGSRWKRRNKGIKQKLYMKTKDGLVPTLEFEEALMDTTKIPINTASTKDEYLPREEVMSEKEGGAEKARLFEVPDADLGTKQTIFYGGQNQKMVDHHEEKWIKYGMSKEYQGLHKMVKEFEKFTLIAEGDISKYDKNANMKIVYRIRHKHLRVAGVAVEELEHYIEFLRLKGDEANLIHAKNLADNLRRINYTRYFTENPHIILPNGDLCELATGNCSGSGCTTGDNCILHVVIAFYLSYKLLLRRFGPDAKLSKKEIDKYINIAIYSDDFLMGLMHKELNITVEEFKQIQIETYAEFGMTLKSRATLYTEKEINERVSEKHSFLGSYFKYASEIGKYVPRPRIEKICSSLVYVPIERNMKKQDYYMRAYALSVHLLPLPELFQYGNQYLKFLYEHEDFKEVRSEIDNFLEDNRMDGVKTPETTFNLLYLGFESAIAG